MTDAKRELLRHTVATLAYRGGKTLRNAPDAFAGLRLCPTTRTPGQILAHISDLLDWALSLARGKQVWHDSTPIPWDQEVTRFYGALGAFDNYLSSDEPLGGSAEKIFQGPLADALTHIGQIAMLRRVAGSPVKGENYLRAEIVAGRVGADQAQAVREFD
jgi:hypothetical protein